ncbi:ATPase H+ transporting accessory protein 1 like a isoform X1 [Lates calcarifer]|uniref:ATPase H+ transporting accessory protein 1 like a isoform X1 n=3 Tax=Lates calcarifer TaxID=8187 RepID=A0AAJ7PDE3_LATCA|nr:ATPase H+ transporting accessory protein 1 like a isoform X1 [Lates calcarifer]
MASPWKRCCCILLLLLLLHLQSSTCLERTPADSAAVSPVHGMAQSDGGMWMEDSFVAADQPLRQMLQSPDVSRRKLLQMAGAAVPFPPLKVFSSGEPCLMFQARRLSLRYEKQKQLDLTERAFSPQKPVDTSQSVCRQDKATLVMRFGDVEDLRALSLRLQLSNTFYESSGQWWFSVDSISLLYNTSEEAVFNASDVYAPASSSYHCLHVSSLQRHSALLLPNNDHARRWTITFTDFQIQAFNVTSGKFSPASDCATFLTPAILMGLITSLILLLVLAYALHMVVHLKHIERDDDHKAEIYFSQYPEQPEHCCVENVAEKNTL